MKKPTLARLTRFAPLETRLAALLIASALSSSAFAAAFTPGNLLIYRVGEGTTPLANTGNPVFIDEYSVSQTGATLVQSIALPTTTTGAQRQCIASGTATSEGLLSISPDGSTVTLTCYASDIPAAASLAASTSANVPRVVARIAADGVPDTSTALTDYASGNNPRSAISSGTGVWAVGGTGGVRYTTFGSTTSTEISTSITNIRQIGIADGNLVISHASAIALGRLSQLTGLPTTGPQTMTGLPGFPTVATGTPGSAYGFAFFDLDATVPGVDVAYVADDGATDAILKFSLVAGSWTLNGSITQVAFPAAGAIVNPRALAARIIPGTGVGLAVIADGTALVVGADTAGYNLAPVAQMAAVATAGTNRAFRGLAGTPVAAGRDFRDGFEELVR